MKFASIIAALAAVLATPAAGKAPADTLAALHSIARYPAYKPERVFALVDQFYPVPQARSCAPHHSCHISSTRRARG